MSASKGTHQQLLRELAALVIAVAGESVTMIKRSIPEQALKFKPQQEWTIYLEFLKLLFNLADRLAAFSLPLKGRPDFMNDLEDMVTQQLKAILSPALGPDADQMEMTITIGNAVAESRQIYERHAFVVTEESPSRADYFRVFGERIAQAVHAPTNASVMSTNGLPATSDRRGHSRVAGSGESACQPWRRPHRCPRSWIATAHSAAWKWVD